MTLGVNPMPAERLEKKYAGLIAFPDGFVYNEAWVSLHLCREWIATVSIEHARTIVRAAPVVAAAKPEIYEALEERNVSYAIRIPANESLEWVYWGYPRMPKWKSWSKLHYVLGAP